MPKTRSGHVIALQYVPDDQRATMERAWLDWAAKHDPLDYDPWLSAWLAERATKAPKMPAVTAYEGLSPAIEYDP